MKIIKSTYSAGTQSVNFEEIRESDEGLKIRINIKSDSYDFQSFAEVSVFNLQELKWNHLSDIDFSIMKTPAKLYYSLKTIHLNNSQEIKRIVDKNFEQDTQILINEAEMILNQKFTPELKKSNTKKLK